MLEVFSLQPCRMQSTQRRCERNTDSRCLPGRRSSHPSPSRWHSASHCVCLTVCVFTRLTTKHFYYMKEVLKWRSCSSCLCFYPFFTQQLQKLEMFRPLFGWIRTCQGSEWIQAESLSALITWCIIIITRKICFLLQMVTVGSHFVAPSCP